MIKKGGLIAGIVFLVVTAFCFFLAMNCLEAVKTLQAQNSLAGLGLIAVIPVAFIALGAQFLSAVISIVCVIKYLRCGVKGYSIVAAVVMILAVVMLFVSFVIFGLLLAGNGGESAA